MESDTWSATTCATGQQVLFSMLAVACRSSNYGYAMGLALQAIHNIANRAADDTVKALDTGLILQCARGASNSAVRNAALALVAVLAGKQPDNTLKHVSEVSSNEALFVHILRT